MCDSDETRELLFRLFPDDPRDAEPMPRRRVLMNRFVRSLWPVIKARVNKVLRAQGQYSVERSDDYCQEVWARLLVDNGAAMKKHDPERGMGFCSFVGLRAESIARNLLNRERTQRRGGGWVRVEPDEQGELGPRFTGTPGDIEDGLMVGLLEEAYWRCILGKLSKRDGLIYKMVVIDGFEYPAICRALGVSMNAVYKAVSKGNKAALECREQVFNPPDPPDDAA